LSEAWAQHLLDIAEANASLCRHTVSAEPRTERLKSGAKFRLEVATAGRAEIFAPPNFRRAELSAHHPLP